MTIGEARDRKPELTGVSGWLLFLCIVLMIYLPLRLVVFLWVILTRQLSSGLLTVFVVLILVPSVVGIVAGILLYREQRLGLRLAQLFLGFQVLAAAATFIGSPSFFDFVFGIIPAVAGLAYLFRSERVRNTSKTDVPDAAEVFR